MASAQTPTTLTRAARVAFDTVALPVRVADRARWAWLVLLGPLAKPLVRDRELRVAAAGSSMMVLALLGALLVPMWVLALGPILWGTAHILGDVRYLWVRPGHHRRWAMWLFVAGPLVMVSISTEVYWGFVAVVGAAIATPGKLWRRALALGGGAGFVGITYAYPFMSTLLFAHAHNLIGVALWWAWRRRGGRLHWVPLAVFVGGGALLMSGACDSLVLGAHALRAAPGDMDVYYHLSALAPGVDGMLGVRLVLLFTFAQSVHYLVWVRLVPEEDRQRDTPRTYAATFRALRADFGWPLLALTVAAAVGVAVWGAIDVFEARTGYLRTVLFHGHLEVAAAAILLIQGTLPRQSTAGAPR